MQRQRLIIGVTGSSAPQLGWATLRALHHHQVHLLARWRKLRASEDTEGANALLPTLLLTINAIASGLRTTG